MSKIAIIGNGNVGHHFYEFFSKHHVVKIFTRSTPFNDVLNASSLRLEKFDLIFLTVPDDNIRQLSNELRKTDAIVVHTSGAKSIDVLDRNSKYGVVYPLQTFSKNQSISFQKINFFIEGNNEKVTQILLQWMQNNVKKVKIMTTENRLKLHLAAVFSCNFTNHMYAIAEEILNSIDLSLKDMDTLIKETYVKAIVEGAKQAQTGPAVRKDKETIKLHLAQLQDKKIKKIYQSITENIEYMYNK